MSSARIHPHPSLPAPVVHASFTANQSKSHVLAGVQDAYWSDDETEDAECPLCLEDMDISDLNFKPCICGYQICRFCWHHIKENLNKRCPACRRVYTDEAVEHKPIPTQDHKRLTQQKKQRERERKELDTLGRRHLANVRVVQRNVVYITGIGSRFAKEELIPTLRSSEYFGQYGKITKILLVKRTPPGGSSAVVGLYITYYRKEDAARCISSVDGTASPSGGREVMRASYGTTKYCMAFLRGVSCNDHNCMNLHEWGDEKDCFTKEDLTTLKHTMKTTETRSRASVVSVRKNDDTDATLPRAASWGQKSHSSQAGASATATRQPRRGTGTRQQRPPSSVAPTPSESRATTIRTTSQEVKPSPMVKPPSQGGSSRPTTPASTQQQTTPAPEPKPRSIKKELTRPTTSQSPAPSSIADSDAEPAPRGPAPPSPTEQSTPADSMRSSPAVPMLPPGLPLALSGPSVPPGLPSPNRPPRVGTASPQTPLLASQSSYQMSNAARALLDDVKARRESAPSTNIGFSPFPDLDRTLQTLTGGENGGFSFNLDPKLAGNEVENALPEFEGEVNLPFRGSYMDTFPALRTTTMSTPSFTAPPGLPYPQYPNRLVYDHVAPRLAQVPPLEREISGSPGYMGSFNPFADGNEESSPDPTVNRSQYNDDDSSRKVSRFGFARGRQGSSATASPLHVSPPLSNSTNDIQTLNSLDTPAQLPWPRRMQQDYVHTQHSSATSSPLLHNSIPPAFPSQPAEFQSLSITEAQLRDFIQASKDRALNAATAARSSPSIPQPSQFNDPAIVSVPFPPSTSTVAYNHISYGPPPGLSFPQSGAQAIPPNLHFLNGTEGNSSTHVSTTTSPVLSSSDFPALTATPPEPSTAPVSPIVPSTDPKSLEKAERKAAKKAAAAEKAAERQKLAQERALVKAAERAKAAQEKAEKEKAVALQAQEKLEREIAEREKEKEKKEKDKATKLEKLEKERSQVPQSEREDIATTKKAAAKQNESKRPSQTPKPSKPAPTAKSTLVVPDPTPQVPLLSKKPKKTKPISKPIKVAKEDSPVQDEALTIPSLNASDPPLLPTDTSSSDSRSHSLDRNTPTSIEDLLEEIDIFNPTMDLANHPFFDSHKLNPASSMPLEYGPLVHALSALSVGGGSFANNMPSGSIDNAVSSFQQLLETLTQTISDLLRLLPRTTWDDSSSFDGVLRDMLKGDDFLDDAGDEGRGKEDEVAALTLALERRARWMEVQLSKLEELHRDINTAAVRAVLAFNDNGWDRRAVLPRVGNSLRRFDNIGLVEENGVVRSMNSRELEEKLAVAKEAAVFAEAQVREVMERIQVVRPAATRM